MKDPWGKAYVYGYDNSYSHVGRVAHISTWWGALCGNYINRVNRTPKPYPVCKNCLRTKRAKELGL
jgi:hypothetical protein